MMARIATRLGMTEGQVYSAVFVVLVVTLLSLTGLPTAERQPDTGTDGIPMLPAPAAPAPEAAP